MGEVCIWLACAKVTPPFCCVKGTASAVPQSIAMGAALAAEVLVEPQLRIR